MEIVKAEGHSCCMEFDAEHSEMMESSDSSMTEMIDDKVTTLKEEIEEIIEEVRNDVEDTGTDLISNMEFQDQSCKKLSVAMNKLTKELQQHGKCFIELLVSTLSRFS